MRESATFGADAVGYDLATSSLGYFEAWVYVPVQDCSTGSGGADGLLWYLSISPDQDNDFGNPYAGITCDGLSYPLDTGGNPIQYTRNDWHKISLEWDTTGLVGFVNSELVFSVNSTEFGDSPNRLFIANWDHDFPQPSYLDDVTIQTDADVPDEFELQDPTNGVTIGSHETRFLDVDITSPPTVVGSPDSDISINPTDFTHVNLEGNTAVVVYPPGDPSALRHFTVNVSNTSNGLALSNSNLRAIMNDSIPYDQYVVVFMDEDLGNVTNYNVSQLGDAISGIGAWSGTYKYIYFDNVNDCYGVSSISECTYIPSTSPLAPSGTGQVDIDASYFINTLEIDENSSTLNPTSVKFSISLVPTANISAQSETINNTINGTGTVQTTFNGLADGTYDLQINFNNIGCTLDSSPCPFPDTYIYSSFVVASGTVETVGEVEAYNSFQLPTNLESTVYESCGITNIGGCINNSFKFLFYPSTNSLSSLTEQYDILKQKVPFIYVYQASDIFTSMYNNPSTAPEISVPFGTFGNITLFSEDLISSVPYASLIRSLIASGIWLMLFYAIYRKTLSIFDNQTTT